MMETSAALDSALNKDRVIFFVAIKVDLPTSVVRLVDGAGEVTWGEGTFKGEDATFGVLDNIDSINDGIEEQAPTLTATFIPAEDADVALLVASQHQGSRIRIWLGALDTVSKAVIADPFQLFDGELDQPTLVIDDGTRHVEMECASNFERLFFDDEGIRLSPGHHKTFWPGELGLDDITGIVRQVIWGPGDKIRSSAPGGAGVGGGGGGHGGLVDYIRLNLV